MLLKHQIAVFPLSFIFRFDFTNLKLNWQSSVKQVIKCKGQAEGWFCTWGHVLHHFERCGNARQ